MKSISKDGFFMAAAMLAAKRSKDPSTQCGAVVVSLDKIIGTGYNGWVNRPKMFYHGDEYHIVFPWDREGDWLNTKYPYVVHGEINAILNSTGSTTGATLYTTLYPCNECAKTIAQSGIVEVVYYSDKFHDVDFTIAARAILSVASVKTRQFTSIIDIRLKTNSEQT